MRLQRTRRIRRLIHPVTELLRCLARCQALRTWPGRLLGLARLRMAPVWRMARPQTCRPRQRTQAQRLAMGQMARA